MVKGLLKEYYNILRILDMKNTDLHIIMFVASFVTIATITLLTLYIIVLTFIV